MNYPSRITLCRTVGAAALRVVVWWYILMLAPLTTHNISGKLCWKPTVRQKERETQHTYPLTQWDFSSGVGPLSFSIGRFAYNIKESFSTCGACSEVVFDFEWKETYFSSWRAKFNLAPLDMPKWVWFIINQKKCSSLQVPHCLQACFEIYQIWKVLYANTQLPITTHVE